MTPLQTKVGELISAYEQRHGTRITGRELSDMLGKSRNHLSQIMNDGLVPSGEALLRLAEVLEAPESARQDLILAAIRTKASARSRDSFWLQQALELTEDLVERVGELKEFLDDQGRIEEFRSWLASREDSSDPKPSEPDRDQGSSETSA